MKMQFENDRPDLKLIGIDSCRCLRSDGAILQVMKGRGQSKPVGTWYRPAIGDKGYAIVSLCGKKKKLHRLVYEMFAGPIPEGMEIDHIDGDKGNNKISNLRAVKHIDNSRSHFSKMAGASSQYRGVCWNKRANNWLAQIQTNGKTKYIGSFKCEKDAAIAYNNTAIDMGFFPEALNTIQFTQTN